MSEPTKPSNELSPEERARRIKAFKEQTSPLIREFLYNIGDEKMRKEIIEKVKNLKANLGPDPTRRAKTTTLSRPIHSPSERSSNN